MKPKLAVIVTHPIQHFAPVYQALAQSDNVDIFVVYLCDAGAKTYFDKQFNTSVAWDVDLLSGYKHEVIRPGVGEVPKGFLKTDAPEIWQILNREKPDAVLIYGYTRLVNWRAWLWANLNRKRVLYCSDSVLHRKRSKWKLWLKSFVLPYFFRGVDTFLVSGDCNAEYFRYYKVPPSRMVTCPLPVDVSRLRKNDAMDLPSLRRRVRDDLTINSEDFVVMICGKMYPGKRPFDLLEAIINLRRNGMPVLGLFVGSGVLLDGLKAVAAERGQAAAFRFTGFVNQSSLSSYYAAADLLALTSSEDAHPLVATEATVFGLPLVLSSEVGCIGPNDVGRQGFNSFVYECGNIDALAECIRVLYSSEELQQRMSRASLEISSTQDVSVVAEVIEKVLLLDRQH